MLFKRGFLIVMLLALAGTGMCGAGGSEKGSGSWYQEVRDLYYGLPVQVSYYPENTQLTARVWAYLESIDDVFNDYKAGSEISAINRLSVAGDVSE